MENENYESVIFSTDNEVPALGLAASSRLNRHRVHTRRLTRGLYGEVYLLQFDVGQDCIARLSRNPTHHNPIKIPYIE